MRIGTGVQVILKFCLSILNGCNVGITDGRFYEVRVEMVSNGMIYTQNFMMIGTGIQAILRFCPKIGAAVMLVLLIGGIYELSR
jgi:hypothetical protein